MRLSRKKGQKGFTLIELLVVIAVISLLSSIIMGQLNVARSKARDAVRISDLQNIRKALELYKLDNNSYPDRAFAYSSVYSSWDLLKIDLLPYISLPSDPLNNLGIYPETPIPREYNYFYHSDGDKYNLIARFEQTNQNDCFTRQYKVRLDTSIFSEGNVWCVSGGLLNFLYSDY